MMSYLQKSFPSKHNRCYESAGDLGTYTKVAYFRFFKMNVEVESDGNKAIISIPAFTFHEFDRTGILYYLAPQFS